MQWILYELSRNATLQEELRDEVNRVVPFGKNPTYDDLQEMPLLRAMVKEALRYFMSLINDQEMHDFVALQETLHDEVNCDGS